MLQNIIVNYDCRSNRIAQDNEVQGKKNFVIGSKVIEFACEKKISCNPVEILLIKL